MNEHRLIVATTTLLGASVAALGLAKGALAYARWQARPHRWFIVDELHRWRATR